MKPKLINFLNEVGKAQLAYVVHHLLQSPVCKLNECRQLVKKLAVAMENYLLKWKSISDSPKLDFFQNATKYK